MAGVHQEEQAGGQQGAQVEAEGQHEQHEVTEVALADAVIDPLAVMVKVLGDREYRQISGSVVWPGLHHL